MKIRKPIVENKYNLKPKDIETAIVLKPERLKEKPFWRNNAARAYCLTETTIKNAKDDEYGCYNEYWIGFYDADAKEYAGKIRMYCSAYGGMCFYKFDEFFNSKEMDCLLDLEIQEKLLARMNWLIEEKIIAIEKEKENV